MPQLHTDVFKKRLLYGGKLFMQMSHEAARSGSPLLRFCTLPKGGAAACGRAVLCIAEPRR